MSTTFFFAENNNTLERAVKFKNNLLSFVDLNGDEDSINDDSYAQERSFLIQNCSNEAPSFLRDCRTISDFISCLKRVASGSGSWQARREFIDDQFSSFLNYLEFGESTNQKKATKATIENGVINIALQDDVFFHVKGLLKDGYYYNAVEEAYKIVRHKLKSISGTEKATDAFRAANYEKIFGRQPISDAEKDFFEGVKFLHMAIQFLRNEKSHTPASELDQNLAIHYISLASLAYDLINRVNND
jgi:uncharacterized protein (TIGR02391 family)